MVKILPIPAGCGRGYCVVVLLLTGLYITSFWVSPLLPFADIGFHLAAADIRAHFNSPEANFAAYYELSALGMRPNLVHHLFAAAPVWPSVLTANRIFLTLYTIGMVVAVLGINRMARGNHWVALLGCVCIYNYNLVYGFIDFVAAMPALLLLLYLLCHAERAQPAMLIGGLALVLTSLFFCHALAAVFGILLIATFAALRRPASLRTSLLLVCSAMPACGMLLWWRHGGIDEKRGLGWLKQYYEVWYLPELADRFRDILTLDSRKLIGNVSGEVIAAALSMCVLLTLAVAIANQLSARSRLGGAWQAIRSARGAQALGALTLAATSVVLLGPPGYPPFWSVYQRFVWLFMLSLVLWSAMLLGSRRLPRAAAAVFVAIPALHAGLWLEHMISFRAEALDFIELVESTPAPTVLGVYLGDRSYRGDAEALAHAGDYFTVLRKRPVVSSLYGYPYSHVRRRAGIGELPDYDQVRRNGPDVYLETPAITSVIVRGVLPARNARLFLEAFTVERKIGHWTLYTRDGGAARGAGARGREHP